MAGRPTDYNPDTVEAICVRLIEGESLRSICRDPAMPAISTVCKWRNVHQEFAEQYARAREDQADTLADEIIAIADEATPEDVNVARLRVDSRKWAASKLKSKSYGDKLEQTHVGDKERPIMIMPSDANL